VEVKKELTDAQWRWVNSVRSEIPWYRRLTAPTVIVSVSAACIYVLYQEMFGEPLGNWASNLVLSSTVLFGIWMLIVNITVWSYKLTLNFTPSDANKDELEEKRYQIVKTWRSMIVQPQSTIHKIMRIIHWISVPLFEFAAIIMVIMSGMVVWGIILFLANIFGYIGLYLSRSSTIETIAKFSVEKFAKYTGSKDTFICKELLNKFNGGVGTTTTTVESEKVVISVPILAAPQTVMMMSILDNKLVIDEMHYGEHKEWFSVDLSLPSSLEVAQQSIGDLIAQRSLEAKS